MQKRAFVICFLMVAALTTAWPCPAQKTNPPYLAEMPPVERVLREIQGSDPAETAARQMGAFLQFRRIILDLVDLDPKRSRDQLTPDESRITQEYYTAYWRIAQTKEEYQKFKALRGYDISPQFLDELFQKYFSPAFRATYAKANRDFEARQRARAQSEQKAFEIAKANDAAAQAQQGSADPGTLAARRCIAAGRSLFECLAEVMGKGFKEITGIIDPSTNKEVPPGLRLNGIYPGQGGFGITLNPGSATDPGSAAVECGKLVPEPRPYSVEMKNSQVVVTVQNEPAPLVLSFRPDGTLAGPGPIDIKGKVVTGSFTSQTTENSQIYNDAVPYNATNVYRDASGNMYADVPTTRTHVTYAPKTERCTIGLLRSTGGAMTAREGVAGFLGAFDPSAKKTPPPPPGLRMAGSYSSPGGLNLEFHPGLALLGCRDVAVVRSYTVAKQESQVVVTIQHDTAPIGLALREDGSLTGAPGSVQVAGRVLAGIGADNQVAFAPRTENCALGTLTPAKQPQGEAAAGAAAARATFNTAAPSRPNNASTPAKPAGPAGTAVLSVVNGFAAQGGAANPLAGVSFFLMKESLETALTKAGFRPPQGMSAIQGWVAACNNGQPVCGQAIQASASSAAALIKADATGRAQLAAVPAGTYYLFVLTRYNNQPILWNLRVDLGPGANSVTLDQRNAAQIE